MRWFAKFTIVFLFLKSHGKLSLRTLVPCKITFSVKRFKTFQARDTVTASTHQASSRETTSLTENDDGETDSVLQDEVGVADLDDLLVGITAEESVVPSMAQILAYRCR